MFNQEQTSKLENTGINGQSEIGGLSRLLTEALVVLEFLDLERLDDIQVAQDLRIEVSRLAQALEVVALSDSVHAGNAAYASGVANQILITTKTLSDRQNSLISADTVSPLLSAAILLAVGDAPGEALGLCRHIQKLSDSSLSNEICIEISYLISGDKTNSTEYWSADSSTDDPEILASNILYERILGIIRTVRHQMLEGGQSAFSIEEVEGSFDEIVALTTFEFDVSINGFDEEPMSTMSSLTGPRHLALLSKLLISKLYDQSSLKNLATKRPYGLAMKRVVAKYPFLWPNHIRAFRSGFLNDDSSAILSFPTGAGKSTMRDFKIADSLDRGLKVVVLAPTNALVDQTRRDLELLFNGLLEDENQESMLSVMTPEAFNIVSRTIFQGETDGLLVFDEFHIIDSGVGPRSMDSMVALLSFLTVMTEGNVLLMSAMIANGEELSQWIQAITERNCLYLSDDWRPIRQLRGLIAFNHEDINNLRHRLKISEVEKSTKSPNAKLKNSLIASPYAIFPSNYLWKELPNSLITSRVIKEEVLLAASADWRLTGNANKVSTRIALSLIENGKRVVIFTQSIPFAWSVTRSILGETKTINDQLPNEISEKLLELVSELGSHRAAYVGIQDSDGTFVLENGAASHHSLLLQEERRFHEELFSKGFVQSLVATSTLSEGMNLPADVVLIAGDSSWDVATGTFGKIEAHRLLNAAGRAGRSGQSSLGLVLIVPNRPAVVNAGSLLGDGLETLDSIASGSEKSIYVNDPLMTGLLYSEPDETLYFIRQLVKKLSRSLLTDEEVEEEENWVHFMRNMKRSFGYFCLDVPGKNRVENILQSSLSEISKNADEFRSPIDLLAPRLGVDSAAFEYFLQIIDNQEIPSSVPMALCNVRQAYESVSDPNSLIPDWFKRPDAFGEFDGSSDNVVLQNSDWHATRLWMEGRPLSEIESYIVGIQDPAKPVDQKLKNARKFVSVKLPIIASLARLVGLASGVEGVVEVYPFIVHEYYSILALCVENGFDSASLFQFWNDSESGHFRRWYHEQFELL